MKLSRFQWQGHPTYGVIEGDQVLSVSGDIFQGFAPGGRLCKVQEVRFLPPVQPRSIVAVGINYPRRVEQHYRSLPQTEKYKGPVIFLMPTSSVIGHLDRIVFPGLAAEIAAAGELVVVMKKQAKLLSENEVSSHLLGYTCGNDLASPDLGLADLQQTLRAHGFDTATSFGPFIETEVAPDNLRISLKVNGEVVSEGSTADMIYRVEQVVSYITQFMTLFPGDLIFTGTPMGAAVEVGDVVEVAIDGIGELRNEVVAA